jgi:hypothetical protein
MRNLFRKLKQENLNLIASEEVRSDKIGSADDQLKRRQTNNYGSLVRNPHLKPLIALGK